MRVSVLSPDRVVPELGVEVASAAGWRYPQHAPERIVYCRIRGVDRKPIVVIAESLTSAGQYLNG